MPTFVACLLFACLSTFLIPAHASWGDESYYPNPSIYDLDKDAQFDSVGLLTAVALAGRKLTGNNLNFESGFTNGQQLVNWVGRSRYAEESPAVAPRIILHGHPLVAEGFDCAIFREDRPA